MKFVSNIGILLLAIYLILTAIPGIAQAMGHSGDIGLPAVVYSILALLAGIFLLIGR